MAYSKINTVNILFCYKYYIVKKKKKVDGKPGGEIGILGSDEEISPSKDVIKSIFE